MSTLAVVPQVRNSVRRVPKLCGADIELGNFVLGLDGASGTARFASRALLREIDAPYLGRSSQVRGGYDPQDWGRRFLAGGGGCAYIDLDHLELCLPEVLSAWDHVAAWHAMLRLARRALYAANARLSGGARIHVLVNNSDGRGHAYGSHLSFLVARQMWDDLFDRKIHYLAWLASFQVSSIVFTGQGKVGAENGAPPVAFQLAQRADFFETIAGAQTTHRRPIVNSRDEALCGATDGPAAGLARLHSIFFDNTLCHGSSLLKVGTMQLVLAMLEAACVDTDLVVDDPVAAVVRWSHDPTLAHWEWTASRKKVTAVELQLRFLENAQRFAASGGFDGVVPRAGEILALWEDTLEKLRAGDLVALAPRLDWVAKLWVLARAFQRRPDLGWNAPAIRHLDQVYGSLDRDEGLYWSHEVCGAVERHVTDEQIDRFVHDPPDDTRAFARAMLLRLAGPDGVCDVDWDVIRFRRTRPGQWPTVRTLRLDDPLGFTRATTEPAMERASDLDDLLDALGATPATVDPLPTLSDWCGDPGDPNHTASRLPAVCDRVSDHPRQPGGQRQ